MGIEFHATVGHSPAERMMFASSTTTDVRAFPFVNVMGTDISLD